MYCTCGLQIPTTGRAALHGLCCKCDREKYGPQSEVDKGRKQIQRMIRKGRISPEKGEQILAVFELS